MRSLKISTSIFILSFPNSSIFDQKVEFTASNNIESARFHDRILAFNSSDKIGFESFDLNETIWRGRELSS